MKTRRALSLEKYTLDDEDIPRDIFLLDNKIDMYANMVPPGIHFFFFAIEKEAIFLSPNYEVVRFKNTNVYLNRIVVKPRLEDVMKTVFVAKPPQEDAEIFLKDKSVFADFREDEDSFLLKCFEQDMTYAKVFKLFKKDPSVYERVKETLFSHY